MKPAGCGLLLAIAAGALLAPPARGDDAPARKTVRTPDRLSLVCEVRGRGDTALLFLHGWCGDRGYWKYQADAFAPEYRVVTLDQAGHGESGKGRKGWTFRALAGDVETVVRALGLKRVILVGHSMGGSVAALAAPRLPGTVVAVVGVDTLQNAESKMPAEVRKQFLAGLATDFKAMVRGAFDGLLHENADPALRAWLLERAEGQDEALAIELMRDLSALDTGDLLKGAKVPVRGINSGGGFKFFTPTAVAVNKKYADYDAVTMDAIGHYPMLERPAEFNQKFRAVLQELADRK